MKKKRKKTPSEQFNDVCLRQMRADEAVLRTAQRWWLSLRPISWDETIHLHSPLTNTHSPSEEQLAKAVAAYRKARTAWKEARSEIAKASQVKR